jgi:hypothetical protein
MVQPLIDAAKVPSLAYTYGGGKLGRKIAAYKVILRSQNQVSMSSTQSMKPMLPFPSVPFFPSPPI